MSSIIVIKYMHFVINCTSYHNKFIIVTCSYVHKCHRFHGYDKSTRVFAYETKLSM